MVRRIRDPPAVADAGAVLSGLVADIVAGHRHEQAEQLFGVGKVELLVSRAGEEVREHGLADVAGIEHIAEAVVGERGPHGPAHWRFVGFDEFRGCGLVSVANAAKKFAEAGGRCHRKHLLRCHYFTREPREPSVLRRNFTLPASGAARITSHER